MILYHGDDPGRASAPARRSAVLFAVIIAVQLILFDFFRDKCRSRPRTCRCRWMWAPARLLHAKWGKRILLGRGAVIIAAFLNRRSSSRRSSLRRLRCYEAPRAVTTSAGTPVAEEAVPQALALGSDRERAPEERGASFRTIHHEVLRHRRDAREVPSQLGDFRPRDSGDDAARVAISPRCTAAPFRTTKCSGKLPRCHGATRASCCENTTCVPESCSRVELPRHRREVPHHRVCYNQTHGGVDLHTESGNFAASAGGDRRDAVRESHAGG